MTKKETAELMALLQLNYPDSFRDQGDEMLIARINLWAEIFKEDSYAEVAAAVKAHIATDTNRFMPPVGVIKNRLVKVTQPEELSEMEAWAQVRKAIRGASMEAWSRRMLPDGTMSETSAERHFDGLPPLLQMVVGAPEQLADWEQLDDDEINTVLQSNFMRSYRARAKDARELAALPTDIRRMIESNRQSMSLVGAERRLLDE